ncbi:MAG: 2-dehydropantoate 2-reductase [Rikenellaceae bacterium]|nr:2-dehydropantoate 2-reductase [Rikenellaceae bacterium]
MDKKFLIVGTGGVGGTLASFLALSGVDVDCIARGEQLETMRRQGLHLKSGIMGEHQVMLNAFTAEEYDRKADVIFVCVKGYSLDSVADVITRAAKSDTLVIPILNVYGTGPRIARMVPSTVTVLDGLIYVAAYKSAVAEITQTGAMLKLIFGARPEQNVAPERLQEISEILTTAHISNKISEDINRDTFIKWSYISATNCAGLYHNVTMGGLQFPGEAQDMFCALSRESQAIGESLGIVFPQPMDVYNVKVASGINPESTASTQKDVAAGRQSEIKGMLFDMVELGQKQGIPTPTYDIVAARFADMK